MTSPIFTAGRYVSKAIRPLASGRRQHRVAHQHFTLPGRRRVSLDEIEVAILDRSVRTMREQPLGFSCRSSPHTNGAIFMSRANGRRGSAADVKKSFNN
jgi:hypothetical protein